MDKILSDLLKGTVSYAGAEEMRVAAAMVARFVARDHQNRWTTHPLGFFHYAEDISPDSRLRVHVWPRGWKVADGQVGGEIHNHVFDLRSLVLAGSIKNETFEAVEHSNGEFRLVEIEYEPEVSRVSASGRAVYLEELRQCVHTAGQIYSVPAGVFHRSSTRGTPAITLVLATSICIGKRPLVALSADQEQPPSFQRRNLNSVEFKLLIEALEL